MNDGGVLVDDEVTRDITDLLDSSVIDVKKNHIRIFTKNDAFEIEISKIKRMDNTLLVGRIERNMLKYLPDHNRFSFTYSNGYTVNLNHAVRFKTSDPSRFLIHYTIKNCKLDVGLEIMGIELGVAKNITQRRILTKRIEECRVFFSTTTPIKILDYEIPICTDNQVNMLYTNYRSFNGALSVLNNTPHYGVSTVMHESNVVSYPGSSMDVNFLTKVENGGDEHALYDFLRCNMMYFE